MERPGSNLGGTLAETRIQLCGPFAVTIDGERVDPGSVPAGQCRLLFGYLALHRFRAVPRDELMSAVWGDDLPPAADAALSALLSRLRRALGTAAFEGRTSVRLALPVGAWVDVEACAEALHTSDALLARGAIKDAFGPAHIAVYIAERELLAGESAPWLDERRRDMAELLSTAYEHAAASCLGIGGTEVASAERLSRRLIDRSPFRESGYRLLMESLAARGEPAEALRVYERLRELLRDELGASPSALTRAVHARLLEETSA